MIQPSNNRFDEEPDELDLPPFGTRLDDDDIWQPDDDDDLALDAEDAEPGLDASVGLADDESEASPGEDVEEDSWLDAGEPRAGLAIDDEAAEDEAEESGWTEGSEPPPSGPDEFADEIAVLEESGEDDSGQEGFSDDNAVPDLELERLPPLAADGDGDDTELEAALTADLFAELSAGTEVAPSLELEFVQSSDVPLAVAGDALPVAWIEESNGRHRFDFVASGDGSWLLQRGTGADDVAARTMCELPRSAGKPASLTGTHDQGRTTLLVGCEHGWVRIVLGASVTRRAP